VNEFKRLLGYAKPYRGRLIAALVAMAVYATAYARIADVTKAIFNSVLPHGTEVRQVATTLLVAYLLKGLGDYVSDLLMTQVGQRVVMDLRIKLFRHILDQSVTFFARRSTGQLVSRLTNDVAQVQMAVSETIADLLRESLAVVGFIIVMFRNSARLSLVTLTAAPLVLYALGRLGRRVRRTAKRGQEQLEHLTHLSTEAFTGHRIVKAFGAEAREEQRFKAAGDALYRAYMRVTRALAALPPLMELLGAVAAVGALWLGVQEIQRGALTTGQFTAFLVAAFMVYGPIKKLSRVNAGIQQTIAAAQRIFEILDAHSEVPEQPDAKPLPRLRESVEFRGVRFAYDVRPDHVVLRDVSFRVRAGQVVALVGLSGAGKTTLLNLIPRFFDPTEGCVLIDGVDVRGVTLRSLRDQVALVTQETVLFDDTIGANIAYGAPQATIEEITQAARAAHAHEFVALLPKGYDTRIGERGQMLSGGQRQRLAIARAILKNSPLLILDEATSSLDAESEQLVQDALANLMRNRTTFVIAHRLSTVRRADFIVVLERGEVAEIGTHDELVGRPGGVYARLYARQAFTDRDAEPAPRLVREVRR
jgi:subfamily B ATP-binding cassette protein MsbA